MERILLDHGSGGKLSHELVQTCFLPLLGKGDPHQLNDSANVEIDNTGLAITTDSFVVDPIFFPGGDIGHLAVCGTVNDLSMAGARPLWLTTAFILEEGLPMADLRRIVESMARTARKAGVDLVAGDTKVVPKGKADKLFINTTGVGVVKRGRTFGGQFALPGDQILISGTVGDHGVAILSSREGLAFETPVLSDSTPLWDLTKTILDTGADIRVMRDPTRGGVATTLNEIALQSELGIEIQEDAIPFKEAVSSACEILGLDLLFLANEGKMLVFVTKDEVNMVLAAMKNHPDGREARRIGEVVSEHPGRVVMRTRIGGRRIVEMLTGEQLPRIC
ncbi:MAG: hydrogenase expression/formation protein HypE [Deltaproteobacteria bacterium]|nr:hydrogenase expression/formation protein HypE [Deltaproteobacteria bacterium]